MKFRNAPIDMVGAANALMDILVHADESLIASFGLTKGVFNQVDAQRAQEIFQEIQTFQPKFIPGGSASNVIGAFSNLGGKAAFFGQVGNDALGEHYDRTLKEEGVISRLSRGNGRTGSAITFITPDHQRTFAAHLGEALQLKEISEDTIHQAKILFLSAYELEPPIISQALYAAAECAKKYDVKVAFDVSDPQLILRNHKKILEFIENYVDVVFVNEAEAQALFGMSPVNALNALSKLAEIAVVKVGEQGSYAKRKEEICHAEIFPVKVVDTTGAGDAYAAGFIYGLLQGFSLAECARLGSFVASRIITKIGARFDSPLAEEMRNLF